MLTELNLSKSYKKEADTRKVDKNRKQPLKN